jgi:hypothetical protein
MKNKVVAKADIHNEIVSLCVKRERGKWRKQKPRIKAAGRKGMAAIASWLNRMADMKIRMLERKV